MQNLLDILTPAPQTFTNFVIGKNSECFNKLKNSADNLINSPQNFLVHNSLNNLTNSIYLWGESGCGCSHLLNSYLNFASNINLVNIYNFPEILLVDINNLQQIVILIDNINTQTQNSLLNQQLFRLIRLAEVGKLTLIIAGNTPPTNLNISEETRTRIGKMSVFQLFPLTDNEKTNALFLLCKENGIAIDQKIIAFIIQNFPRDLRLLIAQINTFDKYCLANKVAPTINLARKFFNHP